MSSTPRTDRAKFTTGCIDSRGNAIEYGVVDYFIAEQLELELSNWKRCAEMLYEVVNPPQGPSGEAIIDQLRDAEELFRKLKEAK